MKKTIAVDIDEVLSLFHEPFLKHHNLIYGTAYVYPDVQDRYYFEDIIGEPSEVIEARMYDFVRSPAFMASEPLPGAAEAIERIKRAGHELVIVTARPPFYEAATNHFIERHFPDVFLGVHTIPHFVGSALNPAAGKLALCQRLDADFLIDDNLGTIETIADAGMCGIVFGEYHWNRAEVLPNGVIRCKNWNDVAEHVCTKITSMR